MGRHALWAQGSSTLSTRNFVMRPLVEAFSNIFNGAWSCRINWLILEHWITLPPVLVLRKSSDRMLEILASRIRAPSHHLLLVTVSANSDLAKLLLRFWFVGLPYIFERFINTPSMYIFLNNIESIIDYSFYQRIHNWLRGNILVYIYVYDPTVKYLQLTYYLLGIHIL